MPVTSDTARAISILASLLWAAGVAGARQYRLELGLDHRLDELAHPIAQADFDRIKPIVEKMDRRLGLRLQGCRVRAIAGHGVVSTGAQTPELLGFQHPETTPPSIPTPPRTAPCGVGIALFDRDVFRWNADLARQDLSEGRGVPLTLADRSEPRDRTPRRVYPAL